MKILLINPPVEDFFFTPQRTYPLALLSLATVLDNAGHQVKILNCPGENIRQTIPVPKEFEYLKRYYQPNKSPFKLFSHYYRFGMSVEQIKQAVKDFAPDIAGISASFSAYFEQAKEACRAVKAADKNICVVLGGRVPTLWPELALSETSADFIVRGEGEYVFLNLCRAYSAERPVKIPGVGYRRQNKRPYFPKEIVCLPDLNSLPALNRRLFDYRDYKFQGLLSTALLASRGCGMNCAFCSVNEPFRWRRAENVLREVDDCFSLGVRHFNFEDDNINFNPEFEKILDGLIEKYSGRIKISFMNGILSAGINKRLQDKLIAAGLTHLDLSVATCDKRLRKIMRRQENAAQVFGLAKKISARKIPVTIHFIVGFPGQTFRGALQDVGKLARTPVSLGPSIFYPAVGNKLMGKMGDAFPFRQEDHRFFRSSAAAYDKALSRDEIFAIFYFSRIVNFIKNLKCGKTGFRAFLKGKTKNLAVKDNRLIVPAKLDRNILGLMLLREIVEKSRICRVQESRQNGQWSYLFTPEPFVSPAYIRSFLKTFEL